MFENPSEKSRFSTFCLLANFVILEQLLILAVKFKKDKNQSFVSVYAKFVALKKERENSKLRKFEILQVFRKECNVTLVL